MITLLIAEDEMMIRNTLVNYIPWNEIGIDKVYGAQNGMEALDIAQQYMPDIVLSDIRMPRMSGIEFCSRYKTLNPDCKLIFLSAYSDLEYYKSAVHLRVVGYVEKPVQPNEIIEIVQTAVEELIKAKESPESNGEKPLRSSSLSSSGVNIQLAKTVELINNEYGNEHLSITSIAERLFLSPNYLSVIFKKEYGITINQYITTTRIANGKKLLEESTLSLNEIAKRIGYRDANYFSKVFKLKQGMNPSDYRKTLL